MMAGLAVPLMVVAVLTLHGHKIALEVSNDVMTIMRNAMIAKGGIYGLSPLTNPCNSDEKHSPPSPLITRPFCRLR
jgi:hypothetical protein